MPQHPNEQDIKIDTSFIDADICIDFNFIKELEPDIDLNGKVLQSNSQGQGVTIAHDFNLGSYSTEDLRKLCLSPTLIGKLYPYLGLSGIEASSYLKSFPLRISKNEALYIDSQHKIKILTELNQLFNKQSTIKYSEIPKYWQTGIASIAFQYKNIERRCPKFWRTVVQLDWQAALDELNHFGDINTTRRICEAEYIKLHMAK